MKIIIIIMIIINNNDNKVPFWSAIAGMVEEVEHPTPTKYPLSQAQNIASDSQVQLLVFTWRNCLEQTGE